MLGDRLASNHRGALLMIVTAWTEEHITFSSEGDALEGVLAYPDDIRPAAAILLLSPHPHMGGNMDNNVVRHLAHRFTESGFATLRFNYRGVGESTIQLPDGVSLFDYWSDLESNVRYDTVLPDVHSAHLALRRATPPGLPQIIIGYSLGAILALRHAVHNQPDALVIISPPNKKRSLPERKTISPPMLVLGGDGDFAYDPVAAARYLEPAKPVVMSDSDHFFRGEEESVFQHCIDFVHTSTDLTGKG